MIQVKCTQTPVTKCVIIIRYQVLYVTAFLLSGAGCVHFNITSNTGVTHCSMTLRHETSLGCRNFPFHYHFMGRAIVSALPPMADRNFLTWNATARSTRVMAMITPCVAALCLCSLRMLSSIFFISAWRRLKLAALLREVGTTAGDHTCRMQERSFGYLP